MNQTANNTGTHNQNQGQNQRPPHSYVLPGMLLIVIFIMVVVGYFMHFSSPALSVWDWMNALLDPLAIALAPLIWLTTSEKRNARGWKLWTKIWTGLSIVFVVTLLVLLAGTVFSDWNSWTGFGDNKFVDWVQMLFGPVAIVLIVIWFTDLTDEITISSPSPGPVSASPPVVTSSNSGGSGTTSSNTPSPQPHTPIVRRRELLLGLGVFALMSGAVALTWDLLLKRNGSASSGLPTPTVPPAPTSLPTSPPTQPAPGTSIYTYSYTYQGKRVGMKGAAWSPDATRIASGGSGDFSVQIWDATTGNHAVYCNGHTKEVKSVSWNTVNTQLIASGSMDNTIGIWNATSGAQVGRYKGFTNGVRSVAWSPDGTHIAGGSVDNTVRVWSIASSDNNSLVCSGHISDVSNIAWSSDSTRIASASFDGTIKVWDATATGTVTTPLRSFPPENEIHLGMRGVAWWDNYIVSGGSDGTVRIWNANTGDPVGTPYYHYTGIGTKDVQSVSWSPDGKYIASGGWDNTVKIWEFAKGQNTYTYTNHTDQLWDVAWSPDGTNRIASASIDGTVQVWWGPSAA